MEDIKVYLGMVFIAISAFVAIGSIGVATDWRIEATEMCYTTFELATTPQDSINIVANHTFCSKELVSK